MLWLQKHQTIIKKIFLIIIILVSVVSLLSYWAAWWYQNKHKGDRLIYGVTFVGSHAKYYDLNPHQTLLALRDDLGFRYFRFTSHWKDIEPTRGEYDFSELDWQFEQVKQVGGHISLAIGLRQPRWPECHAPDWLNVDKQDWQFELNKYIAAVVNRYKDHPSLSSYQLENEYLLGSFGQCSQYGYDKERLKRELGLVKKLDPNTPVIISYATNNYSGISLRPPLADIIGVSVYRRVWDSHITKRYFDNWFPSWYYGSRAGIQEILTNRSSIIHELQAEPWAPVDTKSASIKEQNKSMSADRLRAQIKFGQQTGMREIYLWGGEWWYWRKTKLNDSSMWETIRHNISRNNL